MAAGAQNMVLLCCCYLHLVAQPTFKFQPKRWRVGEHIESYELSSIVIAMSITREEYKTVGP
ncbi:hypothetical protein CCACVL1_21912 [Corchorus capsularis]|uniref:Uncharacterized protein n=1 Tax=Corchorus capsularis TaxID=210143 RepID=A0A1R3H1S5_COCAP|nr:hypothetical protein CCACVL1_21912 [Corchorus capsularis]